MLDLSVPPAPLQPLNSITAIYKFCIIIIIIIIITIIITTTSIKVIKEESQKVCSETTLFARSQRMGCAKKILLARTSRSSDRNHRGLAANSQCNEVGKAVTRYNTTITVANMRTETVFLTLAECQTDIT